MKETRARHIRGGEINRIAERRDELFSRAEWIADNVNECTAGDARF